MLHMNDVDMTIRSDCYVVMDRTVVWISHVARAYVRRIINVVSM